MECKMQGGRPVCSDTCSANKTEECESVPYRLCRVRNGKAECYCKEGLRNISGRCEIAKKVVVKFKITKNAARRRRDTREKNCNVDREELVKMIKAKVPDVVEDSIKCTGDDVAFEVFAENAQKVDTYVKDALKNCGPNCPLGSVSFSGVQTERAKQCKDLKAIADDFGMKCAENETTDATFSCDTTKAEPIGETKLRGIPFQVCKPLPCNKTCTSSDRKHCVGESCVCKPQYKHDSATNECISICDSKPSPCYGEAVCEPGIDYQSFYCRCPPKRTGPLCQRDNKSFLSAQLNIVIVGVVLSSLLLMCFVVSASIISRLKKKLEGPSFKKDPERPTQRELRGYDGPFRASDPASLQRDYTSL
ncbi:uncharacterized protein LOC119393564 [Rhipicephalus sanguineus]|uniref:uncharacterized protein LOC119393564 n=1 Tax=Rhipicephalus sanguineus TaxID=34632 RepID=UPI0020C4DC72|nr:uncharacterized protein LOC119393564 [Rhipicephalus sanguineus]